MKTLSTFIVWARNIAGTPLPNGVEAQVVESELSANPSARLDIDTPTVVARITCWESGDYHAEVIDMETEKELLSLHGILQDEKDLSGQFGDFFKLLGIAAEQ